jgi:putative membrane protein
VDDEARKPSFARLCRLIVMSAWLIALCILIQPTDQGLLLENFLRADYRWLVYAAALVLILFVIALTYCDPPPSEERGVGYLLKTGIMIVPLLYLPTAAVSQLSADGAKKRSFQMTQAGPSFTGVLPEASGLEPADHLSLLLLSMDPGRYEGKRVTTIGMAHWDDELPQGWLLCYRLLMTCCAADARPVGVVVEYHKPNAYQKGGWIKVEGVVGVTDFKGRRLIKIAAESVTPADPPTDPYLIR